MKTVRDIMSPVVYCVTETDFLGEAATALRRHSISGAPVVNERGNYVGFISLSDINARVAAVAGTSRQARDLIEDEFPVDIQSVQVREIMTPGLFKISAQESLEALGESLLLAGVHRLMVEDGGEVVGLVSTTDLIHGFLTLEDRLKPSNRPGRKPYIFESELVLTEGLARVNSSFGREIVLEAPPEFGGSGSHNSPEDLFVASMSSCFALTFAELATKAGLRLLDYRCRAVGQLEGDGVSLRFTQVDFYPRVVVEGAKEQVLEVMERAKKRCLVNRSCDVVSVLHPQIECAEAS